MRNLFLIIVCLPLFFIGTSTFAQFDNSILLDRDYFSPSDSNKIKLHITNCNFLKNNEYFNEMENGFTFIGFMLQPKLEYYPSSNTRIDFGLHLLKYSGKDEFTKILPVFSFRYKPTNNLTFIAGSLSGTVNHNLIEPISQFDRYYFENVENGLQILYDSRFIKSDIWLNWEDFLPQDEAKKEQFSVGGNVNVYLSDPKGSNVIYIPLQALIFHRGGQYEKDSIPLQSIENSASGIAFEHKMNGKIFKAFGTKNYFCTFNDLSGKKQYKYMQGWGEYSNIFLNSKYFNLMLGYWYGEYFIAPEGEQLFLSNSLKYKDYYEGYRNLLTGKIEVMKNISRGIDMGLRFEYYYEFAKKDFDLSYGMNLVFNSDFFIGKIR